MRARALLFAILLVIGSALAACGSGSAGSTSTSSTSTTTTTSPGPIPDVRAMLLTVNDLPHGWIPESTAGGSFVEGCNYKGIPGQSLATVQVSFSNRHLGAEWQEELAAEKASTVMKSVTAGLSLLAHCGSVIIPAAGGQPEVRLKPSRLAFARVGDQSGAFVFRGTLRGREFAIYDVLARFGSVVAVFDYAGAGSTEASLDSLVRRASAKIAAANG